MSTTIDDVHHRNWEYICVCATDITVKRHIEVSCCCVCDCKAHTENGVSAQVALSRSAVKLDHSLVDSSLLECRHTDKSRCDNVVNISHSLEHAFSEIAILIAVTKLESLIFTCRCS